MFLQSSNRKPMDTEKILEELNSRFAAPLPEYYKRRIVFWKDPTANSPKRSKAARLQTLPTPNS